MHSQLARRFENLSQRHDHGDDFVITELQGVDASSIHATVMHEWNGSEKSWDVMIDIAENSVLASCSCHMKGGRLQCDHVCAVLEYMDWTDFPWPAGPLLLLPRDKTQVWRSAFESVRREATSAGGADAAPTCRLTFVLDLEETVEHNQLVLHTYHSKPLKRGGWSKRKPLVNKYEFERQSLSRADRDAFQLIIAFEDRYYFHGEGIRIPWSAAELALKRAAAGGQLHWRLHDEQEEWLPLQWSDDPWRLKLSLAPVDGGWEATGKLRSGEQARELSEAVLLMANGLILFRDLAAPFDASPGAYPWATTLRARGHVFVPAGDAPEMLESLASTPGALKLFELPEQLQYERVTGAPIPRARVDRPRRGSRMLPVEVSFLYGDSAAPATAGMGAIDHDKRQMILRNEQHEQLHWQAAEEAGIRRGRDTEIHSDALPAAVAALVSKGWQVEADGKLLRRSGAVNISVQSGVDWFDLEGSFDFDGKQVSFPKVLSAMRRGDKYVALDDGSHGLLPEEWLQKFGDIAHLGETDGDVLRFSMPQAALLDAMLEAQDNVQLDAKYRRYREKLRSFAGVEPCDAPARFEGQLRGYQQDGLGWLKFLREFGLGGCLADDMGLGKTVQVLALLQAERSRRMKKDEPRLPTLIVVPRSLLFNWMAEAKRFTPGLKMMQYFGLQRKELLERWDEQDVIVTTYGIVRRDIQMFKDQSFHFVVLDEAQAIKNDKSQAAKACRLLTARHRLALTGTPVENHLGELWSLFEFLNPGLLGRNEAFLSLAKRAKQDPASREMIARGIRPFVLRRTKQEVLPDLPKKTEQTIVVEMDSAQRKQYDELRDYYRGLLMKKVAAQGLNRSKIHVLEALLRLRQCACHPRLLDPNSDVPSAKLQSLLATLEELADEGHKALVFSQFTKLLGVLREQLDHREIAYEYLDGRTRKREDRVRAFQENPDCPLFLISLKAGGHGLNLTAADYVFILDPWWNPAVEAQAVDRAHRIGQDKPVFAYRLICRDTVEEKILELQAEKQGLAEAIINADNSLIRDLTADDLGVLLS